MGFFDKLTKKQDKPVSSKQDKPASVKSTVDKPAVVKATTDKQDKKVGSKQDKQEIQGKSTQSYIVLIKPLITEKASSLGSLNKYVFAVNPKMNKVEIKKAIRSVYNVNPVMINVSNFSGRKVRYGRVQGKTKSWKKAIITLKPGDKIEVYEGV